MIRAIQDHPVNAVLGISSFVLAIVGTLYFAIG